MVLQGQVIRPNDAYGVDLGDDFNSFCIDQYAGASGFDWAADKLILYGKFSYPVVRMPNKFD
jgi:hypothetical protein